MNKRELDELEDIRTSLKSKRKAIKEYKICIGDCYKREHEITDPLQSALDTKRAEMLRNKDQRSEYGLTNQTDWKNRIRELTILEENKIANIREDFSIKRKSFQDKIDEAEIEVKDLKMKHENYLAYYSQVEEQKVSIDFNVLQGALDSSK